MDWNSSPTTNRRVAGPRSASASGRWTPFVSRKSSTIRFPNRPRTLGLAPFVPTVVGHQELVEGGDALARQGRLRGAQLGRLALFLHRTHRRTGVGEAGRVDALAPETPLRGAHHVAKPRP